MKKYRIIKTLAYSIFSLALLACFVSLFLWAFWAFPSVCVVLAIPYAVIACMALVIIDRLPKAGGITRVKN